MRSRGLAKEGGGGRESEGGGGTVPCCFMDSGATKMHVLE
jgi:hypothetical protein